MTISYKLWVKIFLFIITTFIFILSCYNLLLYSTFEHFFYAGLGILLSSWGVVHTLVFKLVISDKSITFHSAFIHKTINYIDVTKICFIQGSLEIFNDKKRIKISSDLKNKNQAIEYVYEHLKKRLDKIEIVKRKL